MQYSKDTDSIDFHTELDAENVRLKEVIKLITKKCAAYDEEIKTLLRKAIKVMEENVEWLETELRLIANIDSIENL